MRPDDDLLAKARQSIGDTLELRQATDADSPGIIALIDRCFRDYENCILDVEHEEPALLTPSTSFDGFWVVLDDGQVVGTIACADRRDADDVPIVELKKLYLHPRTRGRGIASVLVALIEERGRRHGMRAVELWTDTRFLTAHRVYAHLGYRRTGRERELHDRSATREFHYRKEL